MEHIERMERGTEHRNRTKEHRIVGNHHFMVAKGEQTNDTIWMNTMNEWYNKWNTPKGWNEERNNKEHGTQNSRKPPFHPPAIAREQRPSIPHQMQPDVCLCNGAGLPVHPPQSGGQPPHLPLVPRTGVKKSTRRQDSEKPWKFFFFCNEMKWNVVARSWNEMKWNVFYLTFHHFFTVDVKWKWMKLFFREVREMRWNEVKFMKFMICVESWN
jgi:hypothetical protein